VAIGWNGVFLAEVARVVKPELAGMATGGTLFFTFLGILIGLPCFSLVVEKSGSYPFGFSLMAMATLVCGIALLLPHTSR
jgi:sugar phosphate permease